MLLSDNDNDDNGDDSNDSHFITASTEVIHHSMDSCAIPVVQGSMIRESCIQT